MKMELEGLSPGEKDGEESDLGGKMLGSAATSSSVAALLSNNNENSRR
ncbi:MAG: hypothetical protein WA830_06305 [Candidatus Sulfotelmatobacter sp.]